MFAEATTGQALEPWCRHLPDLHRAIADPSLEHLLPVAGKDVSLKDACSVWEPLHYLLTALLGWESPGHGLAWWYQAGKPTDHPLLRLVREHWDNHYLLHPYAAWAWTPDQSFLSPDDIDPAELARLSLYPNPIWWRAFKETRQRFSHDPFYGGSNPLHLGHSAEFGMAYVGDGDLQPVLHSNPKDRRAVLVVSSIHHWRRNLLNMGGQLPKLGEHSWHVEVFDRQVGYLGLFRQSRVTGKWFMGKHSVHLQGNPSLR